MNILHFDGGKRKDFITYGCVLLDEDRNVIYKTNGKIQSSLSSNVAEYTALITGLAVALQKGMTNLVVYGDSQLVINQMLGLYRAKAKNMKACAVIANSLVDDFEKIEFHWIPRKDNEIADRETR